MVRHRELLRAAIVLNLIALVGVIVAWHVNEYARQIGNATAQNTNTLTTFDIVINIKLL